MSSCPAERPHHGAADGLPVMEADTLRRDVRLGLQICRASSLSLTRLQLALIYGDRPGMLEAMDRLQDLDSQIGRLLKRTLTSGNDDPEVQAISRHVDEQSRAVAFERLALVSEVSGPKMATARATWSAALQAATEANSDEPAEPIGPRWIARQKVLGAVLALLTFTALACAVAWALGG